MTFTCKCGRIGNSAISTAAIMAYGLPDIYLDQKICAICLKDIAKSEPQTPLQKRAAELVDKDIIRKQHE